MYVHALLRLTSHKLELVDAPRFCPVSSCGPVVRKRLVKVHKSKVAVARLVVVSVLGLGIVYHLYSGTGWGTAIFVVQKFFFCLGFLR